MKLVNNAIPKSPYRRTVENTLKRAQAKACDEAWTHVIVIGQGKETGSTLRSNMYDSKAIYLCELAKKEIWDEIADR